MTLANTMVAKLFAVFVAVAMAFTLAAPAQAQSVNDMSLEDLIAMVNQLQAQLGSPSADMTPGVCPYTWTRSLNMGATGADVMMLQKFLNSMPETQVAPVGSAGSAGNETQYYGPATGAAVANFQMKYRAEILSPLGLVNPTTYFGDSTRAHANAVCVAAPVVDTGTDTGSTDEEGDEEGDSSEDRTLDGGAGSIEDADFISSINNEDVGEGQDDVAVLGLEIEADKSSDLMITALKLDFDEGTAASDLNDYITEVSVWFEGDKIATFDVDEFDEDDGYESTVSLGSKAPIIRGGEVGDLTISVSAVNNLDSGDVGDTWTLNVAEVRFRDGDGAVISETTQGDIGTETRTFTMEDFASAANVELKVSEEDEDINDAQTIAVDDNDDTNDVEVLSFTIEAEGDSDLAIDDLSVDFTSVDAGVGEIINSVSLVVAGDTLDSESVSSTTALTRTITFTDLNFVVAAGETVEVIVTVDVNNLSGGFVAGATLATDVNPGDAGWDVEDEAGDSLSANDKTGSAASDAHQFFAEGLIIGAGAADTATIKDTNGDTAGGEQGIFTIKFEVTAFEADIFIPFGATIATSSVTTDKGVAFTVEDADGVAVPMNAAGRASSTFAVSSTADTSGNFFQIKEGTTETMTLSVTFTALADGFHRAQLDGINYNVGSAGNADIQQDVNREEDFETDLVDLDV